MKRRLYQLFIIVVGLFIIYGSSRNILELWQQKQRIWRIQKEVKELEIKEADLKKQLEYYRSDEYVEKMAREKLLLQKEGETVVILPPGQNQDQSSDIKSQSEEENKPVEQSIWERLIELFRNKKEIFRWIVLVAGPGLRSPIMSDYEPDEILTSHPHVIKEHLKYITWFEIIVQAIIYSESKYLIWQNHCKNYKLENYAG